MGIVQTFIVRDKGAGTTKYFCFLEDGRKFLIGAEKRKLKKAASYSISSEKHDLSRKGPGFLGKVRSNVLGTEFTVCDDGIAPREVKRHADKERVRRELLSVTYSKNMRFQFTPREMTISIPSLGRGGEPLTFQPILENQGILARSKARDERLLYFGNKQPRYNAKTKTYILDFGKRVTMASVKNFQVVAPGNESNVIMQFGRAGQHKFTMDFRWPLSAIQAFGLALSSFEA